MIDKRTEAAARENVDIGGLDLIDMDLVEESVAAVSGVPLTAEPLFTLSPITAPQAALPPLEALSNASPVASPVACPPCSEHDTDVLMDEWEETWSPVPSHLDLTTQDSPVQHSWSPLMQPHLLQSQPVPDTVISPLLQPWEPIPTRSPLTREQSEELPMLDQAWSRHRQTARDTGHLPRSVQRQRARPQSVYRRNHTYSIAEDIEAGMQEEEDEAMASPSARKSTPFIPFTFSPPSSRLFTHPGAHPRVTKTYGTKTRGAQSSPPYKGASSTKQQQSGLSHSSPSYAYQKNGLPDAKMYPTLSKLSFAQPADIEDNVDKQMEAERQDEEQTLSRWGGVALAPAPLRTTPPQTPPRRLQPTNHQKLYALLAFRKGENQKHATGTAAAASPLLLPPSSPLTSLFSPSSPSPPSPPASSSPIALAQVSTAPDHWCSLLTKAHNFAVTNSQAWGGGEAWTHLVTLVMEFLDPLMENGQHPVRLYYNIYLF